MKKLGIALAVLVLIGAVMAAGAYTWVTTGASSAKGPAVAPDVTFEVPKGATGQKLGQKLVDEGLVASTLFWRVHLREKGTLNAKAGKHTLSARMTIPEIAKALEVAPMMADEPFAMIEGWRLRDTDAALVAKGWIKPGEYISDATTNLARFKAPFALPTRGLEGYLYPETYRVIVEGGFKLDVFLQQQLDTFSKRFYDVHKVELEKSGRSLDQLVIMASMLEREEPVPAQRDIVSGILWKRIDKGYPLGVDATSRYTLAEWNDRTEFLKNLRNPDEPYNTRLKAGLPPGPIGAPTVDSLVAAMRPQKNEFFYYLHDSSKTLHPSRNAEEHEALRKKYNVY